MAARIDRVGSVPAGSLPGDDRGDGHSQTAVDESRALGLSADATVTGDDRPGEREVAVALIQLPPLLDRPEHSLCCWLLYRPARLRPERTRYPAIHVAAILPPHRAADPSPELCYHRLHLLPEPGHLPGDLAAQPHRQAAGKRPPLHGNHQQREYGMGYRALAGTPEHGCYDGIRALGSVAGSPALAHRISQGVSRRCSDRRQR